ncbi:Na+/H+ antiporter NhaA [Elizabethkingia argentiflava]|uniref:Na(+)/H(+) antiporter NhaA n=1 Tax=Elizabethkingia argenteiflava TaxID=2681556 RepID=A0A845PR55_9FLAO|nr:Na+/H+ antiporter NhaA [Elizabethkingia argenteiflava]NAW50682.1 Na+/H+ antiporter NhaA [Elizabethkingia argenteiflava]
MKLTQYFKKFFDSSQSSGILLITCVFISIFIANSSSGTYFQNGLDYRLGEYTVSTWINDGLMTFFFLLVGLEIKREMLQGELSRIKNASLPILAAVGGMLVPALIYSFFNQGTEYAKGWGIPMATDIAFSLAIISLLSKHTPLSLKIFLAALAIVDDLGAILVIAIFYTDKIIWTYLGASLGILLILMLLNKGGVKKYIWYLLPGLVLWYCIHHSGIHATISGVLLAFSIPSHKKSKKEISPLEKLEERLYIPVNYIIMPLFALANTNIVFHTGMVDGLFTSFGAGIIGGLVAGKLTGILLFSFIGIKLGLSSLPLHARWSHMVGVGLLAGIGFTMSVFISILSFKGDTGIQDEAKFAILIASSIAGLSGYSVLKLISKNKYQKHL